MKNKKTAGDEGGGEEATRQLGASGKEKNPSNAENQPTPKPASSATVPPAPPPKKPDENHLDQNVLRAFIETQAPEIVRSHSISKNSARGVGIVMIVLSVLNFGTVAYFGLRQASDMSAQTNIQRLAQRISVGDALSKPYEFIRKAQKDIDSVVSTLAQFSDGKFTVRASLGKNTELQRSDFMSDLCLTGDENEQCRSKNVYDLLSAPSLGFAEKYNLQLSSVLDMLVKIDDTMNPPTTIEQSIQKTVLSGIVKSARDSCESESSDTVISQLQGRTPKRTMKSEDVDALIALSSSVDRIIHLAHSLFLPYKRLLDNDPRFPNATIGLTQSMDAYRTVVDQLPDAWVSLRRDLKQSAPSNSKSPLELTDFVRTIGLALVKIKGGAVGLKADCDALSADYLSAIKKLSTGQ